jgi:quinoprotein glucose dehydrogenase
LAVGLVLALMPIVAHGQMQPGAWSHYAADAHSTKYSPLSQINASNFKNLKVIWRTPAPDNEVLKAENRGIGPNEATPIFVDGTLYTSTSLNYVVAMDAATGRVKWAFQPAGGGGVHRGVAYWQSGNDKRILFAGNQAYLCALNAETGALIQDFGDGGRVDLTLGLRRPVERRFLSVTSPVMIVGDVAVVGGGIADFEPYKEMPPGDVRGFDVRNGKLLWTFHSIPQPGEFGHNTWLNDSWKYTGSANVWTWMSADPELGYVYLPFGTPNNDWYGGHRHGDGLFGESVVCLDAKTGKRIWHYQLVHHGLWDYDIPCAPNLVDVVVNGKKRKLLAQVTKQAMCFVFDRVTGKPIWPIEERPVPPSRMPGEKASPTQPHVTRPAPFDRQGAVDANIIDFTPALKREAKEILKTWEHGPMFNPPTTRRSMEMPGWVGGASWAGASVDPETGILYVGSVNRPMWVALKKPDNPGPDKADWMIGENGYEIQGPRGLPLFKPPYGRITAIDLKSGNHVWMAMSGKGPVNHPAIKHLKIKQLGRNMRTYTLVTKTLLLAAQEGSWFADGSGEMEPPVLRAYDKKTGRLIGEVPLPGHATGSPMVCMAGGKQLVVIPIGGGKQGPAEWVAVGLP